MKTKIDTIDKLYAFLKSVHTTSDVFNRRLLKMYKEGKLDEDVFVEYLDLTQADIDDCMREALGN